MEFDSPEAEQEFPGLFTEDKAGGDDESRKILSVKKKKDKDKGYKAFEEDGSGGSTEDVNKVASSSRRFKFGKSSSKSSSKPVKVKLFGVELRDVVQRNPSDDPKQPLVPRFLLRALNWLESEYKPGANFYKGTSHFKSKIHAARHGLNYGEELPLQEPQIVAGLVKLFVRELPGHMLGPTIESKLEEARPSEKKAQKIQNLYKNEVPAVNRAVFERLVLHMEIIGIDLTPLLRVSQRGLGLLKSVLSPLSIEDELKVEEARLARMHAQVAKAKEGGGGGTKAALKDINKHKDNEEKLWEAQRNVTQLKRKLKQMHSLSHTDEKEVELNLEERRLEDSAGQERNAKQTETKTDKDTSVTTKEEAEDGGTHAASVHKEKEATAEPVALTVAQGSRKPDETDRGVSESTAAIGVAVATAAAAAPSAKVEVVDSRERRFSKGETAAAPSTSGVAIADDAKACPEVLNASVPVAAIETKVSPGPGPRHHQILQPVPAPSAIPVQTSVTAPVKSAAVQHTAVVSSLTSDLAATTTTQTRQDVPAVFAETTSFDQVVESFQCGSGDGGSTSTTSVGGGVVMDNTVSTMSPFGPPPAGEPMSQRSNDCPALVKPEALTGKPALEDAELQRIQQEWRFVIAEQVELLRLNHELRRRIRDEHKQMKMIQMVRNHKSRLSQIKPVYHDPLEKIPTEKLREVLQRFIESNALLTQSTQGVATQVFDEKLALARARALDKCPAHC